MIFTKTKVNDGYTKVTIDNPPINLFGPEFSVQLMALMDELEADENLKVVVFESANPDYFIAHLDVLQANDFPKGTGRIGLSISWPDIARRLELASFLSIASIRGRARGLGSEFVQAFDIRFASKEKAFLAQVEIGIGSWPGGGGMERLPLLIGRSRALEVIMSGEDFDAETAAAFGWVNRAIPDAELDEYVDKFAKRVSSFDKEPIANIKSIMNRNVTLATNENLMDTQVRFFESLQWPKAVDRIKRLFGIGLQQNGETELNLPKHL